VIDVDAEFDHGGTVRSPRANHKRISVNVPKVPNLIAVWQYVGAWRETSVILTHADVTCAGFGFSGCLGRLEDQSMPVNEWSESIVIAELTNEPAFSEDMDSLLRSLDQSGDDMPDVIVNMKGVSHVNSSNLSQLLKLRKCLGQNNSRLRICSVNDQVWSVFLMTGLDNVFDFTEDVSTSLASLQIEDEE